MDQLLGFLVDLRALVQVGHGRRSLAEAAARQAGELAFFPLWSYAHPAAIDLAELAIEETGFGVLEDKVVKNYVATEFLYDYLKDKRSVGVVDSDKMGCATQFRGSAQIASAHARSSSSGTRSPTTIP